MTDPNPTWWWAYFCSEHPPRQTPAGWGGGCRHVRRDSRLKKGDIGFECTQSGLPAEPRWFGVWESGTSTGPTTREQYRDQRWGNEPGYPETPIPHDKPAP